MSATQAAGQVVAGRYRLERALARGGMGSVWIARHLQLDIDVAVKFMTAEAATSANARVRFEREAKAAAKLKSAHIKTRNESAAAKSGTPQVEARRV